MYFRLLACRSLPVVDLHALGINPREQDSPNQTQYCSDPDLALNPQKIAISQLASMGPSGAAPFKTIDPCDFWDQVLVLASSCFEAKPRALACPAPVQTEFRRLSSLPSSAGIALDD